MNAAQPEESHRWLKQLVGDWIIEGGHGEGCSPSGTEHVRMLGDLWLVGESEMTMPDGGTGRAMITIGYDPQSKRFVGTWVGTMMTKMWIYDGELDPTGRILSLYAEGPTWDEQGNFSSTEKTLYRDAIELKPDGTRIFTGSSRQKDGSWKTFMTSTYRRKS